MDSGQVVASACVFHVRPIGVGFAWPHPYFVQKTKRTNRFENYDRLSFLQTFFHRSSTCVSQNIVIVFVNQAGMMRSHVLVFGEMRQARAKSSNIFFIAQFLTCWVFLIPQMAVVILTSNGRLWRHCAVARGGHCKVPCLGAMVRCHFPNSFMVFGVYAGVIFWTSELQRYGFAVKCFVKTFWVLKWWRGLCCLCELSVAAISLFLPCPAMQLHWFYGRCALECKRICFHEAGDLVFCELSHFP